MFNFCIIISGTNREELNRHCRCVPFKFDSILLLDFFDLVYSTSVLGIQVITCSSELVEFVQVLIWRDDICRGRVKVAAKFKQPVYSRVDKDSTAVRRIIIFQIRGPR